jgi:hypothetical protein
VGRTVTQHVQRAQKVLEDANIKVASVLSTIMCGTSRDILAAVGEHTGNHVYDKLGSGGDTETTLAPK